MKLTLLLRPPQKGHCEDELSSVLVFFSYSDLGSARSQQGQGIAQCDTAENMSLLCPVLPRDSIVSKLHSPRPPIFAAIWSG